MANSASSGLGETRADSPPELSVRITLRCPLLEYPSRLHSTPGRMTFESIHLDSWRVEIVPLPHGGARERCTCCSMRLLHRSTRQAQPSKVSNGRTNHPDAGQQSK